MGVQGGCVGISLIIRPTEIAGCSFHRHPSKPAPSGLNRCGGPVPRVAAARRTLGYERMSLQDMAWMDVVRGRKAEWNLLSLEVFGRCMLFGFPLAQFFTVQTQRSGHRGPPPRHPVGGSIRTVVFGWVSSGGLGPCITFGGPPAWVSEDEHPAERTRRSAPPPPGWWVHSHDCLWMGVQRGAWPIPFLRSPLDRGSADPGPVGTNMGRSGHCQIDPHV